MEIREDVIQKVGHVLKQIFETLCREETIPRIHIPYEVQDEGTFELLMNNETQRAGCTTFCLFEPRTARHYARFMAVFTFITELIMATPKRTVSLRDVYYALKHEFTTQEECNAKVLEVGRFLGLKRHEMGVVPAAKGLIAGPIAFRFQIRAEAEVWVPGGLKEESKTNESKTEEKESSSFSNWTNCLLDAAEGGGLIRSKWTECPAEHIEIDLPQGQLQPRFLLIVEKEGIFKRLCEDRFFERVPCIIVTGCGYPDVATRALVTKLHAKAPFLEPVGVCDYNPHGLALLLTYKATSRMSKSRFETSDVTTDAVKWLGLRSAHMQEIAPRLSKESLQPMGNRDVQKLQAMRRSDVVQGLPDYCEEISAMEEAAYKCELESMFELGLGFFSDWLEERLKERDFI